MDGWTNYMLSLRQGQGADGPYDIDGASIMASYGTDNATATNTSRDINTLIWFISMMKVLPDPDGDDVKWPQLPVNATECALFYCVNSYTANVTNGILHENEQPATNT